jgi:16S rRNA (adenine1518-N6/adenine1519-N6)-dimethyltransferase
MKKQIQKIKTARSHPVTQRPHRHVAADEPQQLRALRAFGQNFLIDEHVLDAMEDAVRAGLTQQNQPPLCEIGPGMAALTKRLLKIGPVVCIEKDTRAVEWLQKNAALHSPAFAVVQGDILQWQPNEVARLAREHQASTATPVGPAEPRPAYLVGNLPYNISSDFLLWFCAGKSCFAGGVFLLQREVVDRLAAKPGIRDYGRLTAQVGLHYTVEKLFDVPPSAFQPQPQVVSSFVRLTPRPFSFASSEERQIFEGVTAALFSQRRKMLRSSVAHLLRTLDLPYADTEPEVFEVLRRHGVEPTDRPETISPQAFIDLSRHLLALKRKQG